MKRLSRPDIDKAVRMRLNGSSLADVAHSIGVSFKTLQKVLARYELASSYTLPNGELDPPASALVHVGADEDYPGFDLLPEDAARLHEVRSANGWYGFHKDYTAERLTR